jgi:uncharacterized protein
MPITIVDAHIHAYPPEVFVAPRDWAEARGERWWADTVAPRDRSSIQGWADVDQLIRDMDAAQVDQAVMLGWYWEQQTTCEDNNSWMAAWQQAHPDRLHAFVAVNPAVGATAVEQTRRWLDHGFCGIGELLDRVQGYRYADDSFALLAELAREYGVPFNLHVTDPKLDARPGMQPTPLAEFTQLATALPDNRFILAHLGGGLALDPAADLPSNLYFDTAATPLIYDAGCYRQAIACVGAERVLFGTDYPLRVYPRRSKIPEWRHQLAEIRAAGLSSAEFDAMMGANLQTLLTRD